MTDCLYCTGSRSLSDNLALGPCVCAPWSRVEHIAPGVTLYCGDSLEVLPALTETVHSAVVDPPYGLGAHPDPLAMLRAWLAGEAYHPGGSGFMGKEWDGFVPGPEMWREVMRLLPPGGHLLSAFGTRTVDLGGLAVRLAGFEIRDMVAWMYATGFPKSLDVSKAIDKAAGAVREVEGHDARRAAQQTTKAGTAAYGDFSGISGDITSPATSEAREWQGWGTALKPALEPFVLARKPLDGTVAQTVLAHRTGALHIDACRVAASDALVRPAVVRDDNAVYGHGLGAGTQVEPAGRWPANLLLSYDEDTYTLADHVTDEQRQEIARALSE